MGDIHEFYGLAPSLALACMKKVLVSEVGPQLRLPILDTCTIHRRLRKCCLFYYIGSGPPFMIVHMLLLFTAHSHIALFFEFLFNAFIDTGLAKFCGTYL